MNRCHIGLLFALALGMLMVPTAKADFGGTSGPWIGGYFTVTLSSDTPAQNDQLEWIAPFDGEFLHVSSGLTSGTIATMEVQNQTDTTIIATLLSMDATPEVQTTLTNTRFGRGDIIEVDVTGTVSTPIGWNVVLTGISDRNGDASGQTVNNRTR